jgi:fatty acid desaturase
MFPSEEKRKSNFVRDYLAYSFHCSLDNLLTFLPDQQFLRCGGCVTAMAVAVLMMAAVAVAVLMVAAVVVALFLVVVAVSVVCLLFVTLRCV